MLGGNFIIFISFVFRNSMLTSKLKTYSLGFYRISSFLKFGIRPAIRFYLPDIRPDIRINCWRNDANIEFAIFFSTFSMCIKKKREKATKILLKTKNFSILFRKKLYIFYLAGNPVIRQNYWPYIRRPDISYLSYHTL